MTTRFTFCVKCNFMQRILIAKQLMNRFRICIYMTGNIYFECVYIYIYLFVYSGIYLFLYFFTRIYSSASSYPSVHLSIMLPAYRSTSISVCLSIYLSTYLLFFLPISVCMSECFHIYQCLYFVHQCIYTGIFSANVHLYIYPQSIFTLNTVHVSSDA